MSKSMSEQMQKLAARYEKATGKKFNAKTNADRIRAMSDEELAAWMAECNAYREYANASQWLPWLQQPEEEQV